jgi:hypothetical protein
MPDGWLKVFGSARGYQQAARALEHWRFGDMPVVLARDPGEWALLLSHVPGDQVPDEPAWAAAGQWLRGFQQRAPGDPMPLTVALGKRLDAAVRGARPHLDDAELNGVLAAWTGDHDGVERVRCHRDLHPRNWRWDGHRLGVIDFEHAAPDHPLADWVRLLDDVALDDPRMRALTGPIDGRTRSQLRDLQVLHALGSVAWGARNDDAGILSLGLRLVRELSASG